MLAALKERNHFEQEQVGRLSWFIGLSQNVDRNRISYNKWMTQFKPIDKLKRENQTELEDLRELYINTINRKCR